VTHTDRAISRPGDPHEDRLGGAPSVSGPGLAAIAPAACPVCNDPAIIELPIDWRSRVDAGGHFDLVGCGNPWHYRDRDPDPLGAALDQAILSDDHHDGGLLLPLMAIAAVAAVVAGLALYGVLHLLGILE
jgi:hypothetical protein